MTAIGSVGKISTVKAKFFLGSALALAALSLTMMGGNRLWHSHLKYQSNSLAREVRSLHLSAASNKAPLELRKVSSVDWDELIIWEPYSDICEYGIDGFRKGSGACESYADDNGYKLLFLKGNRLAGMAYLDTAVTGFAGYGRRIRREGAVFDFSVQENGKTYALRAER